MQPRRRHMWPLSARTLSTTTTLTSSNSITSVGIDSFFKNGRKISIGDCALFKPPQNSSPPFIGIIRRLSSRKDNHLKLGVTWLYRPAEVKLNKGTLLEAAPNEIFYSFHEDEIHAASILHPCKVAFLRKGVQLPAGVSSFVCRRVYDIKNQRLCWLDDKDYINERQEEVDKLLGKTRVEMHAAVQSGGRSPKPMNGPASTQLKPGSDGVQNSSTAFTTQVKGKKRERGDLGSEPNKRERSVKSEDEDSDYCRSESMLSKIAKITDKGRLVDGDGVEKLVQLMQPERAERKIDLASRITLADIITATDKNECLVYFVQKGLPVLDEWLQEVHKGKINDSLSPKGSDKSIEEFLFALLRALDKLPVNLHALQNCNIGKSVNHLRSHKNLEIQKKARGLVDMWKKRVEAEMKINDAKSGSNQTVSWPSKPGFSEVSQGGNRRMDSSSEVPVKNSLLQLSTNKTAPVKVGQGDVSAKSASVSPGSVKSATSLPDSVAVSSKDVKEEKSSSSSQSQNNSQSYSSDHMKTLPSVWKEDARSSTAGSPNVNKASSGTSRHRRSSSGILGAAVSGVQKEASIGKSGSLNKSATSDKVSHSGLTCERTVDTPMVDHGKSHRLIVKFSNRGRSPARSGNGGSPSDPSVAISGASSPVISEKHDPYDRKVKGKNDSCRPNISSDIKTESWQSNDVKDGFAGSDEQEGSPATIPDEDHSRIVDENGKHVDVLKTSCSSTGNRKGVLSSGTKPEKSGDASLSSITALIESCMKYSEANAGTSAGDDGMNLLASVAAGETSKPDLVSPNSTPARDSPMPAESLPVNDSISRLASEDVPNQSRGQSSNGADKDAETNSKGTSSFQKGKPRVDTPSIRRTLDPCLNSEREPDENNSAATSSTSKEEEGDVANHLCRKTEVVVCDSNEDNMQDLGSKVIDENKKVDNVEEKLQENSFTVDPEVHGPRRERCSVNNGSASVKDEKESAEESCTGLEKSNGNKKLVHEGVINDIADPGDLNRTVVTEENDKNAMYPFTSGKASNLNGGNDLTSEMVSRTETETVKEQEESKNVGQACDVPPTCGERTSSGVCSTFDKKDRGTMRKSDGKNESVEHHSGGSVLHEDATIPVQEVGLKSSICKESTVVANETEDCVSKTEALSASVTAVPDKATMFDFDLNEGFCLDDGIQDEPVSSVLSGNVSALHQSSSLPVPIPPMTSGLPASVTIASAAKGPFVPPENPLKSTGQLGWKGSAATSAFRPAEPRKVLEMPLSTPEIHPDISPSKHDRAPLAFDLNVSDERASEDMASQSSTQKTHSELKLLNYGDMGCSEMRGSAPALAPTPVPVRSAVTLDLDLNRVGEDMDNGQSSTSTVGRVGVPLMPDRSTSTGAFPNGEVNVLRNFDLNNGPAHDEMGSDPVQHIQHARSTYPSLPPLAGYRMNNSELGSLSSWFTPGNSYPTVAFPSVLPDRGEHPYPIIASAGMQRISGPALGPDVYRPVLSSSPAMGFSPGNQFPYPGFPFSSNFPVPSTSFSGVSTTYMDSSTGGSLCFPAVPSQLVGPAGTISTNYPRPYVINLPDASINSGTETSRKWGRQNLDLNAGPGGTDREGRDERFPSASRQLPVASSQAFPEDQMRLYHQAAGVVLKRKEPEGGWDSDRFSHKQPSWQ